MPSESVLAVPPLSREGGTGRATYAALALLSLAHFFIDLYSSALSAFQPLLVDKFNLSLSQAGLLGGALVFSSSLLQPVYGMLSDRFHTRLFTVLAPAVAGIFISSTMLAPSYAWVFLMVLLGGAGIASFHPQASANATLGIVRNPGRAMAAFISSGTMGMAIGPAFFSFLAVQIGAERTWLGALPGIAITLLLWYTFRLEASERAPQRMLWAVLKPVWRPLGTHYALVFIRSVVQMCFTQFLPLYLHRERGFSVQTAALGLTLYLASGAIGGFLGGHMADRFGGRRVILISMLGCLPFLALFFLADGWLALVGLALAGLMILFTIPVNVVMGQRLLPGHTGTVSALLMGFAWGSAGLLFIPLTGWAADRIGLHAALASVSVLPLLGWLLARTLPEEA